MEKYSLYDYYERKEKLGEFDTLQEVAGACIIREFDTDGEMDLQLFELKEDGKRHRVTTHWTYNEDGIKIYPA